MSDGALATLLTAIGSGHSSMADRAIGNPSPLSLYEPLLSLLLRSLVQTLLPRHLVRIPTRMPELYLF
jgi:hypothetical protein